jgi:hypothetical protein
VLVFDFARKRAPPERSDVISGRNWRPRRVAGEHQRAITGQDDGTTPDFVPAAADEVIE